MGRSGQDRRGGPHAGAKGPAVLAEAVGGEEIHPLGTDSPKLMFSRRSDVEPGEQLDEAPRDRDLGTIGDVHDAGSPVHCGSEIVSAVGFGFTHVKPDPDPQLLFAGPVGVLHDPLGLHRGTSRP